MSKRDDQKLAALVKKNAARIKPPTQERAAQYDDTLRIGRQDEDSETRRLFKEMKKREF